MKHFLFILLLSCFFFACHHSGHVVASQKTSEGSGAVSVAVGGGDGSSFDSAVVILAKSEGQGVNDEYKWLKLHYPGYALQQQSLVYHGEKPYDVMHIKTADGEDKKIYFDISGYFGKW